MCCYAGIFSMESAERGIGACSLMTWPPVNLQPFVSSTREVCVPTESAAGKIQYTDHTDGLECTVTVWVLCSSIVFSKCVFIIIVCVWTVCVVGMTTSSHLVVVVEEEGEVCPWTSLTETPSLLGPSSPLGCLDLSPPLHPKPGIRGGRNRWCWEIEVCKVESHWPHLHAHQYYYSVFEMTLGLGDISN